MIGFLLVLKLNCRISVWGTYRKLTLANATVIIFRLTYCFMPINFMALEGKTRTIYGSAFWQYISGPALHNHIKPIREQSHNALPGGGSCSLWRHSVGRRHEDAPASAMLSIACTFSPIFTDGYFWIPRQPLAGALFLARYTGLASLAGPLQMFTCESEYPGTRGFPDQTLLLGRAHGPVECT